MWKTQLLSANCQEWCKTKSTTRYKHNCQEQYKIKFTTRYNHNTANLKEDFFKNFYYFMLAVLSHSWGLIFFISLETWNFKCVKISHVHNEINIQIFFKTELKQFQIMYYRFVELAMWDLHNCCLPSSPRHYIFISLSGLQVGNPWSITLH